MHFDRPVAPTHDRMIGMPPRICVAGSNHIAETVARTLPDMEVFTAPGSNDEAIILNSDCLMVGSGQEQLLEMVFERMPVVELLPEEALVAGVTSGRVPAALVTSSGELRLALRSAILEYRARRILAALAGPWAHDARGALGVAQLALKLMETGADSPNVIQKAENGVTRLGYLTERLPSQIALALDLPLSNQPSASIFPSLDSFARHLRRVHPRRSVELVGGEFVAALASARFVPFAAGFVEFALKLSDPQAAIKMTVDQGPVLELECECPNRPHPWDVQASLDEAAIARRGEDVLPYRLVEAARLATRLGVALTLELTGRALLARVQLV